VSSESSRIEETADGVTFDVQVAPRASRDRFGPVVGDRIKVAVTAPPVDGKANAALIALLARILGVPRSQVAILRGHRGKRKTVSVKGVTRATVLAQLPAEQEG
jgi:uncharacterized protein (TIGR00251 family)